MAEEGSSERPGSAARRPWWMRAAIVGLGLVVGLALAELGLRAGGFEYRLAPEVVDFGAPSRREIEAHFLEDAELVWVPRNYDRNLAEYGRSHPPLIFMGDSCTQLGTYPSRVTELVLRDANRRSLAFANLGVVGWSTYQGRRQFDRDVAPLGAKVVTVFFGWNDHWVGFGVEDEQLGRIASFTRSALADARIAQVAAKFWVAADPRSGTRPNRVSLDDFRANLTHIVRAAREHGVEPVLITAPSNHTPSEAPEHLLARFLRRADELVPMHQEYVQAVRDVAADEDAPLCDLARHFSRRDDGDRLFHTDGIHPNAAGDEVIATQVVATLREHGLVDRLFE